MHKAKRNWLTATIVC
ncbi:MAG: KxYKxGKxW signal peptide domain-containing protein [Aquamicrobium sp.]|nr:KxYKxGKxW signal peptide domain-containing protein [Aquamicrobium sp.]